MHWAGPMNFGIETLGGCGHKLFPEHARHSNGDVDTPTMERNVDADSHSKGRLVRMAIDHSNGASILACEIKKGGLLAALF